MPDRLWAKLTPHYRAKFHRHRKFYHPCLYVMSSPARIVEPTYRVTIQRGATRCVAGYRRTYRLASEFHQTYNSSDSPRIERFDDRTASWSTVIPPLKDVWVKVSH